MQNKKNVMSAADQPTPNRILTALAILTIAFSVVVQLILLRSDDSDLLIFARTFAVVAIPGTILALFGFFRHFTRTFKNIRSALPAALFLLITLLPALPILHNAAAMKQQQAEEASTQNGKFRLTPAGVARTVEYSEEHKVGMAWAQTHRPAWGSECTTIEPMPSLEFLKGCYHYFNDHLKKPVTRWEGMTTAECRREVNAMFKVMEREYLENGNTHGAAVNRRRSWGPELEQCKHYDQFADQQLFTRVYPKLDKWIDRMKAGEAMTDGEIAEFKADFNIVSGLQDQPYKSSYLERSDELHRRIAGTYQEPVVVYPDISCTDYQLKIDELRRVDQERSDSILALNNNREDVPGRRQQREALNQQRIDALWDWKLYNDGANAAGCDIRR
ncbi:MAG: hypothetical protein Q7J36_12000 [Thiobacillus sp.]|nr:hypothetical protein [Thiobacillus sp.]